MFAILMYCSFLKYLVKHLNILNHLSYEETVVFIPSFGRTEPFIGLIRTSGGKRIPRYYYREFTIATLVCLILPGRFLVILDLDGLQMDVLV